MICDCFPCMLLPYQPSPSHYKKDGNFDQPKTYIRMKIMKYLELVWSLWLVSVTNWDWDHTRQTQDYFQNIPKTRYVCKCTVWVGHACDWTLDNLANCNTPVCRLRLQKSFGNDSSTSSGTWSFYTAYVNVCLEAKLFQVFTMSLLGPVGLGLMIFGK